MRLNGDLSGAGLRWLLCLSLLMAAMSLQAQEPVNPEKPFAEKFVILQLSDGEPEKQTMALSVAGNLLEYYDPELVDIEITTFGPGVRLLYEDNQLRERVSSLMAQGIRFSVCVNTIDTIERQTGERPELHPQSVLVPVGVAHILEQIEKGYVLVRP